MGIEKSGQSRPSAVRVVNAATGNDVAARVDVATSLFARGRGLMLRAPLPEGHGLLIDPCSSIHSFWMRFPIDVLYVDRHDVVVRIAHAMRPWRVGPLFTKARYVIELPAGGISASGTAVGDRLRFEPASPAS